MIGQFLEPLTCPISQNVSRCLSTDVSGMGVNDAIGNPRQTPISGETRLAETRKGDRRS